MLSIIHIPAIRKVKRKNQSVYAAKIMIEKINNLSMATNELVIKKLYKVNHY